MFPLAVRAYEGEGRAAAQEQMRHNATLLMLVGVPAVVGLVVLAPGISHAFFGERFRAAASGIMPLVALGSFLAGLKAYHFDSAFQFVHKTAHQVWIVLVAAVVNVGLNLLVVRRFGINGSAAASVAAYAVSIALTVAVGRRHFTLPFPLVLFTQVVACGCVMGAALWPFRHSLGAAPLAAQVCAGAAVYGAGLVLMNFQGIRATIAARFGAPDGPVVGQFSTTVSRVNEAA
jgi:O-antigen/teichoic acid export membrane protein